MPLAEERADDELDLVALAEHDVLDVVEQRLQDGARVPRRAQPLLARRLVAHWEMRR